MLRWSINLFRVGGIQLSVHVSFLLLLTYYGYDGWQTGAGAGLCWSVGLVVLFFICVILHELGHSLTAMRYGVKVPRILLLPIGGMAEFDRMPRKPSQELLITIAGPAVNFVLAAILLPFTWQAVFGPEEVSGYTGENLLAQLFVANVIMGTFNLLPVFPMDGGRIFRALLATKLPYLRATYWAVLVGKILALAFALLAAFYFQRPLSYALFLFIYWAGDAEYRQTLRHEEAARYWTEMSRRLREMESGSSEPPASTVTGSGPN